MADLPPLPVNGIFDNPVEPHFPESPADPVFDPPPYPEQPSPPKRPKDGDRQGTPRSKAGISNYLPAEPGTLFL